jgi:transcriptional regulator with XRE-family HTH domain
LRPVQIFHELRREDEFPHPQARRLTILLFRCLFGTFMPRSRQPPTLAAFRCKLYAYSVERMELPLDATGQSTVDSRRANQPALKVSLGKVIRAYRTEKKLSCKEVAARMGYSPQHYGDLEKGLKIPADISALLKLAAELDRDPGWLLQSAWDARDDLDLPVRLPLEGDPRRQKLIDLVLDIYSDATPRLP